MLVTHTRTGPEMTIAATRSQRMRQSVAPFLAFFTGPFAQLNLEPGVANFAVGNPQEMPLPAYVGALQRHVVPQDKDWSAYKLSEPASQRTVADALSARTGLDWDPDDVATTNGGFAVDISALERRRDRLVPALREMGYDASMPEGTFYTMARSPIADDAAFAEILARHRVLVLPGSVVEVPAWFRISLTASDEMVDAAIPRFAAARREALG